jgi:hypothetical protein
MTLKLIVNIALIVITIVTGFILHKKGKPYHKILFYVHKFATLGFVVWMAFILVGLNKTTAFEIAFTSLLITAVIGLAGLFFSGAMLSVDKAYFTHLWIHRLTGLVFLIGGIFIFYKLIALL